MKVSELIEKLSKLPPDQLVVLAKDREGDGNLSPLEICTREWYEPSSAWSGDLYASQDKEASAPAGCVAAVVLWPKR